MNLYRSLLWWLALAVLGALGWHWFSQDLGDVVVRFRGLTYTTTLAFLVVAWALLWFGLWTLGWLLGLPLRAWRRHARTQARNRLVSGLEALHQGRWARAAGLLGKASEEDDVRTVALQAARRAALGAGDHEDLLELLACTNLLVEVDAASFCFSYVEVVALGEFLAVELVEVGDLEWVEQVPVFIVLDTLHELVRDPDGCVRGTGTTVGVTRVLTQVKELGEVHVPVLHVEAESTELLTTTADRTKDRVNGVHEGDRTGRSGVVRTDW